MTGGAIIIPTADDPAALAVTDGSVFVGSIVERDGSFFSFDANGTLIGEYATRSAAMRSPPFTLPARGKP